MATMTTENFGELLEPGLRKIFFEAYKEVPTFIPEIFNMETADVAEVHDVSIGAMKPFSKHIGTVKYDKFYEGYKKSYDFPPFSAGFSVEREMFDDQRYGTFKRDAKLLGLAAGRRRELDAAFVFNSASVSSAADFDGDVVATIGGDGQPLCSDAHPSKAPDGPATRSNKGSLTLTQANLDATVLAMRNTVDDRGNKIMVMPDTLIVPEALEPTAWEIIKTDKALDSANNNKNIHFGRYKLIVWPYLTDPNNWFMLDSTYTKMFLNWFTRVPLEFNQSMDMDTMVAKFMGYMRFGVGWSDWVGVYGNFPI